TEAFAAPLVSDRPDGLWPTVVVDEHDVALGLAYSNLESLRQAIALRRGVYWSRSRGGLWVKGESSGAVQELLEVAVDCDRDALRFRVRQAGPGFCHRQTRTCWGESEGVSGLAEKLRHYLGTAPAESYTRRLASDPQLLGAKLREEAGDLAAAQTPQEIAAEAGDVIYFTLAKLAAADVRLAEVEQVLAARRRKVTRRPGNAKI
ncbi:MAG: phosphoribosyl-ATP diphosphatase, partial [Planctomycetota bacterium]